MYIKFLNFLCFYQLDGKLIDYIVERSFFIYILVEDISVCSWVHK